MAGALRSSRSRRRGDWETDAPAHHATALQGGSSGRKRKKGGDDKRKVKADSKAARPPAKKVKRPDGSASSAQEEQKPFYTYVRASYNTRDRTFGRPPPPWGRAPT